jgi:uncharacterized delta-60 repeat protein
MHKWIAGIVAGLVAAPLVWAAAGLRDPSFNGSGSRMIALDRGGYNHDVARSVRILPDGRIAVAGFSQKGPVDSPDDDFALVMLQPSGALDGGFGSAGVVVVPFDTGVATDDFAWAMALDPLGRIVLVGEAGTEGSRSMAVARITAAGTLDTTFSIDGKTLVPFGPSPQAGAYAVAVQPDQRIVLAGAVDSGGGNFSAAVARLTASGALDPGFASGGSSLISLGNGVFTAAQALLLQADGRVLLAGVTVTSGSNFDMFVMRLLADGSPDPGFGVAGVRTIGFDLVANGADIGRALALQPDGRILVAGSVSMPDGGRAFGVARLLPNGTLDPAFGTDGLAVVDFALMAGGEDTAGGVVVDADGGIFLVGSAEAALDNFDVAVLRLRADGTPDPGFGTGGRRTFAFDQGVTGYGQTERAQAAGLDAQGRLVLVGHSNSEDGFIVQSDMLVMRLLGTRVFADGFEGAH